MATTEQRQDVTLCANGQPAQAPTEETAAELAARFDAAVEGFRRAALASVAS
jgi:hypothetical protein